MTDRRNREPYSPDPPTQGGPDSPLEGWIVTLKPRLSRGFLCVGKHRLSKQLGAIIRCREMIEFLTQMTNGTKISLTMEVLGLVAMLIVVRRLI